MSKLIPTFSLLPAVILLLTACAATSPSGEKMEMPVFPPAPNETRFFYERSLLSSADVEIESGESLFQRIVTGVSRTGIGMGKPFGVTVHKGRVFVSDTLKRLVFAFDIREGKFIEIGTDGPGELVKPMGLDVDLNGNLYVCDASLKQVLVYDRDGNFKRRLGEPDMFDRPAGLTVNPNGTRLYVVDTGGVTSNRHRVLVFDAWSGGLLHTISRRGQAEGELICRAMQPSTTKVTFMWSMAVISGYRYFRLKESTCAVLARSGGKAASFPGPRALLSINRATFTSWIPRSAIFRYSIQMDSY